jgi:uncharacterized repeat protein (TIGR01451 family)
MKTQKLKQISIIARGAAAAAALLCALAPASAQVGPTLLQEKTSPDGLLTLTLWSANGSDAAGVNNSYTWIATNNSATVTLTGVILGSHWGDRCPVANCGPVGPTLISLAPGCGGQSQSEFPAEIAKFGIWCTPSTGVALAPGQSVSGSVTLRPLAAGAPDYTVYTGYNDPVSGKGIFAVPAITNHNLVAPAATDIQITGAASNGSPPAGSTFTYTYQVKNAGPWGTGGGLTFVDTLPASLTYVSSSLVQVAIDPSTGQAVQRANPNGCSVVGQTVSCRIGDLDNGGAFNQATIALTVASGAPQQIVNTASVLTVPPQDDSNPTNNGVTVTVTTK